MEQGRRRENLFTVTIMLWSILDRNSPLNWEDNLISMDHLMWREKDLYSFVWTPQSVSPSFPILPADMYIHILEKIPNRREWSFTSNTLCLPAIIFSFLYNASWLSFGSFLCNFSSTNTIRETKQKIAQTQMNKKRQSEPLPMMLLAIPVEKPSVQTWTDLT